MPRKVLISSDSSQAMRPALTPEARENQMIALAVNLAEQQLRDGTASSQVITHYLKLATENSRLERLKLEADIKLANAKIDALESGQRTEELYKQAIEAMQIYTGRNNGDDPNGN